MKLISGATDADDKKEAEGEEEAKDEKNEEEDAKPDKDE